jgi:hypothetical protein
MRKVECENDSNEVLGLGTFYFEDVGVCDSM